jgi:hypothetical protein
MKYIKIYEDYLNDKELYTLNINAKNKIIDFVDYFTDDISYKDFIDEIAKKCNTSIKNIITYGTKGVTFETNDNNILKITTDINEIINCYNLIGKKNKHVTEIKNVYKITKSDKILGVILMEKLNVNLTPNEIDIINYLCNNKYYNISPNIMYSDIKSNIKNISIIFKKERINYDIDIINNFLNLLQDLAKNSISSHDITSSNIGHDMTNNNLKMFDFGYHTFFPKSDINKIIEI